MRAVWEAGWAGNGALHWGTLVRALPSPPRHCLRSRIAPTAPRLAGGVAPQRGSD